jgi:hypothetical protein
MPQTYSLQGPLHLTDGQAEACNHCRALFLDVSGFPAGHAFLHLETYPAEHVECAMLVTPA